MAEEQRAKEPPGSGEEQSDANAEGEFAAAAGQRLFEGMVSGYVEPEVERREAAAEWSKGTPVFRFQVQFFDSGEIETRLNEEVSGYLEVKATGPIEKGQVITTADFSEISSYRLPEEHEHHPHVTAFMHDSGWFLAFQLGGRDPGRHDVLARGREFLATAHDALASGRIPAALDNAHSAIELLANAELLSCAPTLELAQRTSSHGTLHGAYNVWSGRLGNSDQRFAKTLNRLAELRPKARYLSGEPHCSEREAEELLVVLDEMERHVTHLAEAPMHELPQRFTVIASRAVKAGELVGMDATTLFPST